ncbi:hypothetical protein PanWU01x14_248650 [Parasponia andersonii]|uniref:Uncharacterized protein n=1 Tax=Parasponia andersonii TaxID=3476 RepID=A0A2P5BDL6_PARAD|nr:hypothetical protein PanWU01x14_248650 [Parasponia andersonii]
MLSFAASSLFSFIIMTLFLTGIRVSAQLSTTFYSDSCSRALFII